MLVVAKFQLFLDKLVFSFDYPRLCLIFIVYPNLPVLNLPVLNLLFLLPKLLFRSSALDFSESLSYILLKDT